MADFSENNKRIAKNTIALYIRMLFLLGVNLFATRVVLQALGVDDYGIYNVVGGVVALFSILSQSLSTANSRFMNFEMGRGDFNKLKRVFSACLTIQIGLSIIIAIIAEIAGYWFINYKMVLPPERIIAANWVLQFSIISFCINLISVPYNAAIIAHEKMSAFAYISIYEGIAKLLVCYMVMISPIDKLVAYSFLICAVQFSVRMMYTHYCKKHFEECIYTISYDKPLLKELFSYSGWNFIGASASVIRNQGGTILINLFGGPALNAARGIANQINNAIFGFSGNFMTAVKPQITKSYAAGNIEYMTSLVNNSARFSFYLLLLLSLPIIINIDYILGIWLTSVPYKSSLFVVLTIIFTMVESWSNPLIIAQLATGRVKRYQIVVGGITLLNIPINYILLIQGCEIEIYFYVSIFLSFVTLIVRLVFLHNDVGFDVKEFIHRVVLRGVLVLAVAIFIPFVLSYMMRHSFLSFIVNVIVCLIYTGIIIFFLGFTKNDKKLVITKFKSIIKKHIKRDITNNE